MIESRRATTLRLSLSTLEWLKIEALRSHTSMAEFLESVIALQRGQLGSRGLCGTVPCPACGARSYYARSADRFVHADGSGNRACWVNIVRGQVSGDGRTPIELERAMRKSEPYGPPLPDSPA